MQMQIQLSNLLSKFEKKKKKKEISLEAQHLNRPFSSFFQ